MERYRFTSNDGSIAILLWEGTVEWIVGCFVVGRVADHKESVLKVFVSLSCSNNKIPCVGCGSFYATRHYVCQSHGRHLLFAEPLGIDQIRPGD